MWQKLRVVLIEADIFNKAVQANIPMPLRNLYINFDVNTLRQCGEMACVEEHLHTFLKTLTSLFIATNSPWSIKLFTALSG